MSEPELVCPKCGYQNQPHRSTCKSCGTGLTPEAAIKQQVVVAKRKKPLKQREDWIGAGAGLFFLITGIAMGVAAVYVLLELQMLALFFAVISVAFIYAGFSFFLFPVYSLYVFLQGHAEADGQIVDYYEKEGTDEISRYVVIYFIPESAIDPRPRQLTCNVISGILSRHEGAADKILVSYAVKNPNVMVFGGEF